MQTKRQYIPAVGRTECFSTRLSRLAATSYSAGRALFVFAIVLVVGIALVGPVRAAGQPGFDPSEKLDPRWFPWIGSWRLISDNVASTEAGRIKNITLDITPGDGGGSVAMKGLQDETLWLDKQIKVDGLRHALNQEDCEGWYTYTWSDTGKRLLFDSQLACSDGLSRTIAGISFFIDTIEWADIQLVTSGKNRAITIRRYQVAGGEGRTPVIAGETYLARATAGSNFSIEELIELNNRLDPQILEAALVEMHKPFNLDSKTLVGLADAGVPSQVLDLVVALSFPEKFTVERYTSEPVREADSGRRTSNTVYCQGCAPFGIWSFYDPFFRWYWRSPGWFYGYWGWGGWPGYYPPIWIPPGHGGDYRISGGRLIAGQGYAKVTPRGSNSPPRYAQPRSDTRRSTRAYSASSGSGTSAASRITGSTASRARSSSGASAISRSSGSGGSGGSRSYSRGGSSSASPRGYSGGSSRQARPRD
jgi:hypothetical protein